MITITTKREKMQIDCAIKNKKNIRKEIKGMHCYLLDFRITYDMFFDHGFYLMICTNYFSFNSSKCSVMNAFINLKHISTNFL